MLRLPRPERWRKRSPPAAARQRWVVVAVPHLRQGAGSSYGLSHVSLVPVQPVEPLTLVPASCTHAAWPWTALRGQGEEFGARRVLPAWLGGSCTLSCPGQTGLSSRCLAPSAGRLRWPLGLRGDPRSVLPGRHRQLGNWLCPGYETRGVLQNYPAQRLDPRHHLTSAQPRHGHLFQFSPC